MTSVTVACLLLIGSPIVTGCTRLGDFQQHVWIDNRMESAVIAIEDAPEWTIGPHSVAVRVAPRSLLLASENGPGVVDGWLVLFDEQCNVLGRASLPQDRHAVVVVQQGRPLDVATHEPAGQHAAAPRTEQCVPAR